MKVGRKLAAVAATAAVLVCAPAAEAAVTVSVTGDGGAPVALAPGAPLGIRNMDIKAFVHVDAVPGAASYSWQVTDAGGVGATTPQGCWNADIIPDDDAYVTYRGNGAYALTLNVFSAKGCAGVKSTQVYSWTVNASVSLGQPAGPLLIRQNNSFSTITQNLDFAQNPGASTYEIKYAKGGVVQPDGSISSPALQDGFLNRTTGKVEIIGAREPGDYVVVARAKYGDFYTPWSVPVTMKLMAPFDLASRRFPDSRGPSYQVRGEVREHSAAGSRVTVAIAKGKKGKHFRTLGKAKVTSKGIFKLRFTVRKRGAYRLRYSFSGNGTVQRGTVYESVTIRRILV